MEKIKNNIEFNTAIWDYGMRTLSNSFFSLFILIVFLFMADSIAKVAIVIFIIICLLIIMNKFIYKVLVLDNDVYLLSYLFRRKRIKPLKVYVKNRAIIDVCRSIAHELVHHKQNIDCAFEGAEDPGADGSEFENEANAVAGVIIRKWGKLHPEIYD